MRAITYKQTITAVFGTALLLLSACSSDEEADDVLSETELGNVDVIEGTINDDMVQPDTIDVAAEEQAAADAADDSADGEAAASEDASDASADEQEESENSEE